MDLPWNHSKHNFSAIHPMSHDLPLRIMEIGYVSSQWWLLNDGWLAVSNGKRWEVNNDTPAHGEPTITIADEKFFPI